ncbi:hypothetical protein [Nocardia pseudovaccinii]|uniref:hypothetical protein n=1 Tax=Nocardia pseudovaccinii TaxID=189540 RepID=UPI0007A5517E|nr:hypothetical protein [Nocardia pseudovaccinii]
MLERWPSAALEPAPAWVPRLPLVAGMPVDEPVVVAVSAELACVEAAVLSGWLDWCVVVEVV